MEFFRIIDNQVTEEQLQAKIHPKSIEEFNRNDSCFLKNVEKQF